jgi:hypothetical protein
MGDSRPNSLVFCHAHSAQILEFRRWPPLDASAGALGRDEEKPEGILILRQLFIAAEEGKMRPFQPCGNETFPKKFPQASTRLSKANLERCSLASISPADFRFHCFSIPA